MKSLILGTAVRFMLPLLLLFSVFILLRGHDLPGGGFVGGLVAAAAFALYALSAGVASARSTLGVDPHLLIGGGLLVAVFSGAWALLLGRPFLTDVWFALQVPVLGAVAFGTPLLFDVGVYMVVLGVMLMIILSLAEE